MVLLYVLEREEWPPLWLSKFFKLQRAPSCVCSDGEHGFVTAEHPGNNDELDDTTDRAANNRPWTVLR